MFGQADGSAYLEQGNTKVLLDVQYVVSNFRRSSSMETKPTRVQVKIVTIDKRLKM